MVCNTAAWKAWTMIFIVQGSSQVGALPPYKQISSGISQLHGDIHTINQCYCGQQQMPCKAFDRQVQANGTPECLLSKDVMLHAIANKTKHNGRASSS
jgi:hypothetical protein